MLGLLDRVLGVTFCLTRAQKYRQKYREEPLQEDHPVDLACILDSEQCAQMSQSVRQVDQKKMRDKLKKVVVFFWLNLMSSWRTAKNQEYEQYTTLGSPGAQFRTSFYTMF